MSRGRKKTRKIDLTKLEISDHAIDSFRIRFKEQYGHEPRDPNKTFRELITVGREIKRTIDVRLTRELIRGKGSTRCFECKGWFIVVNKACTRIITIYERRIKTLARALNYHK